MRHTIRVQNFLPFAVCTSPIFMRTAPATIFAILLSGCSLKLDGIEAEGEAATGATISGDVIVENAQDESSDTGDITEGTTDGGPGGETGPEICDGIDNDGDGDVDEGLLVAFYWDEDGDGWGGTNDVGCELPEGASLLPGDCDDTDASIHPEAVELCNGIDENCNYEIDEGVTFRFYADTDGDGYGTPEDMRTECTAPDGYVDNDLDCNDEAAIISPESVEFCNYIDDNCDGEIDEDLQILVYPDNDSDGFGRLLEPEMMCGLSEGYTTTPGDCDDDDASINPDGVESCNDADDDCNGLVDDDAVEGTISFWSDLDGDGHGNGLEMTGCSVPDGYAASDDDCDDLDSSRSPSTPEICNDIDDNCNDSVDEGVLIAFYEDNDADGYGTSGTTYACIMPEGAARFDGDCDDTDDSINPGASEYCNGLDENCNGLIDDSPLDGTRWFTDADGDGFGAPLDVEVHCEAPPGFVDNNDDCNPEVATINPGADEVCNGFDDNCDDVVDIDAVDAPVWYRDADGDGFGDTSVTETTCVVPIGFVDNEDDCDDSDPVISPDEDELCDDVDNDCNGLVDDAAIDTIEAFPDEDEDGFGSAYADATLLCEEDITVGWSTDNEDCDDEEALVNPVGVELCNGIDDNCNGDIDEDSEDRVLVYPDNDLDGFGSPGLGILTCEVLAGWSLVDTDCNDENASVFPGADEYCNGINDDCDDSIDEDAVDRLSVYPDEDGDGYGDLSVEELSCELPDGWSITGGDCEDDDDEINPGVTESCDGYDENCDDIIDNGADDCGSNTVQRNLGSHSYIFTKNGKRKSWTNARDWCEDRNYTLVTINSSDEQYWIINTIRYDSETDNEPHWTGLNDRGGPAFERYRSESGWLWESGETYSYSAWSWGQPDNSGGGWEDVWGGEDCVEVNRWRSRAANNDWNDLPCDSSLRFICEASP